MKSKRLMAAVLAVTIISGSMALGWRVTGAQNATPAAEEAIVPRPAHIHSGNCNNLGEIVQPLNDLTGPSGRQVGQRRAIPAETSFTSVPMTLEALLSGDYAINVHLSADQIGTYIACGEIGGTLDNNGALVIGLHELSNSGYTGIAYLAPGADGASTGVSVFVAPTQGGGRAREQAAGTPAAGAVGAAETPAAALPVSTTEAGVSTPQAAEVGGTPAGGVAAGTPATGGAHAAGGQQVNVSESEFALDMPTTVPAGRVTFSVTNNGTITHSFEVEGNGVEKALDTPLSPGQTGTLSVKLAPGTYTVYCPIANHADLGMRLTLTAQ